MANLTHLFEVKQNVRIKNDDFDSLKSFNNGIVKEVYEDHIIVTNTELGVDGYYEEGFNINLIYPDYNFMEIGINLKQENNLLNS